MEPQDKPKVPEPRNIVSGGLPGMGIARDLMYVDFTVPKEVLAVCLDARACCCCWYEK